MKMISRVTALATCAAVAMPALAQYSFESIDQYPGYPMQGLGISKAGDVLASVGTWQYPDYGEGGWCGVGMAATYVPHLGVAISPHDVAKLSDTYMPRAINASRLIIANRPGVFGGIVDSARIFLGEKWFQLQAGSGRFAFASDLNDQGLVVGYETDITGQNVSIPSIWGGGQRVTLPHSGWGQANALNSDGLIAGVAFIPEEGKGLVLWKDRTLLDLGIHYRTGYPNVECSGINDNGQVLFNSWFPIDFDTQAQISLGFIWNQGTVTKLPPLDGDNGSHANDINRYGLAVGTSFTYVETGDGGYQMSTPVIWRDGVPEVLPTPGFTDASAVAINDRGEIVGTAWPLSGGQRRAVVWRPASR